MSIKKSLAWMGIAQAAVFLIQFICSVVLARYLSPQDMGVFAIGLATIGVLALLQSFGLQPLIVREEVLTPSIRATAFTVNAVICLIQAAATAVLGFAGGSFFSNEGVKHVLLVLSITPLFGIFSFLPGAELERNARFKATALITLLTTLAGGVATMLFAVLGLSYMSLAYGQLISSAALASTFIVVGHEYFSCRLGLGAWRRVSNFGAQMFAYSAIVNFSQRFCEILLGRVAGLASLGLYSRAVGLNNIAWGNIHYLVSRVVLVDFATLRRAGMPLKARYMQTVAMITATLWPAFAGLAVLATPFIVILYGPKWSSAALPLTFLSIASIIQVSMTMSWELFAVSDDIAAQTRVELIRNGVSVPLFVGACFISINAVAFTRIIDAGIAFVLYRPHLDRLSGASLRNLGGIYLTSAIVTLAAVGPASALMILFPQASLELPYLAAAVLLGITLWASLLFVMKHPLAEEAMRAWNAIPFIQRRRADAAREDIASEI